jgi:LacI family transcriptional regulator
MGHREIVFLGARSGYSTTEARMRGFMSAHQAYRLEPGPMLPGEFTREDGYAETKRLLSSGTSFTAIFAVTDMVACGVLQALREANLRVPQDVSVVGYDDIPFALDLVPALTSVHVPMEEIGRTAVRLALHPEEKQHVVLGTHVVIRDSAAPRTSS